MREQAATSSRCAHPGGQELRGSLAVLSVGVGVGRPAHPHDRALRQQVHRRGLDGGVRHQDAPHRRRAPAALHPAHVQHHSVHRLWRVAGQCQGTRHASSLERQARSDACAAKLGHQARTEPNHLASRGPGAPAASSAAARVEASAREHSRGRSGRCQAAPAAALRCQSARPEVAAPASRQTEVHMPRGTDMRLHVRTGLQSMQHLLSTPLPLTMLESQAKTTPTQIIHYARYCTAVTIIREKEMRSGCVAVWQESDDPAKTGSVPNVARLPHPP